MAEHCPWFASPEPPAGAAFEEHLAACPLCQRDAAVEHAIWGALRGVARPQLSPFFDRRLMARLARERHRQRTLRRWKRTLQLYWLVVATASAVIVLRLPWQEGALTTSPVLLATLAVGGVLPVVLLLAALRKDPIDLLFETLDWLG